MRKLVLIILIGLIGCASTFEEKADKNFAIIQQVLNNFNQRLAKVENNTSKEKAVDKKKEAKDAKAS
jgi:hypothetical protein